MTTTRRTIAALDVPAAEVAAEIRERSLRQGALAEQRHQYRDLDPDSACCLPGLSCPACPPASTAPPEVPHE